MANELLIRTMKDDVAEIGSAPKVVPTETTKPVTEKQNQPVMNPALRKTFIHAETITTPKSTLRDKVKFLVYGIVFFAVVGAGYFGYTKWDTIQSLQEGGTNELAFYQIIPSEALALVRYDMNSDENRNTIRQLWGETGREADKGVGGNPTALLSIPDISQVYYLAIPGIPEPYLIIENTAGTKEFVSQYREDQVLQKGNWFIVHDSKIEDYAVAVAAGTIAEDSTFLASSDSSTYLVRYALSAPFVSRQFQTPVSAAVGLSRMDALVFHVVGNTGDDTIRASALVAGDPPGEGVVEGTAELLTLVPSDISFGRVGFNFAEDLEMLPDNPEHFDSTVLAQPAVRQFAEQFNTPYAIFERKGSDGVPDVGLILALPAALKQQTKTGDSIVEQSLPALIPLIIGKTLGIQVAFSDGEYKSSPLRYVNIIGQTQTLDYLVGDNFLLFSSSREGMNALIETSLGEKPGVFMEEPLKSLSEKAAESIKDRVFITGSLTDTLMMNLLPVVKGAAQLPIIVSSGRTSTGLDIQLVLSTK